MRRVILTLSEAVSAESKGRRAESKGAWMRRVILTLSEAVSAESKGRRAESKDSGDSQGLARSYSVAQEYAADYQGDEAGCGGEDSPCRDRAEEGASVRRCSRRDASRSDRRGDVGRPPVHARGTPRDAGGHHPHQLRQGPRRRVQLQRRRRGGSICA